PAVGACPLDARVEIEALFEVDVGDVVAADVAAQRTGAAPDVDAAQARNLAGQRHQEFGDVLEVIELAREALQLQGCLGFCHECTGVESHFPQGPEKMTPDPVSATETLIRPLWVPSWRTPRSAPRPPSRPDRVRCPASDRRSASRPPCSDRPCPAPNR